MGNFILYRYLGRKHDKAVKFCRNVILFTIVTNSHEKVWNPSRHSSADLKLRDNPGPSKLPAVCFL